MKLRVFDKGSSMGPEVTNAAEMARIAGEDLAEPQEVDLMHSLHSLKRHGYKVAVFCAISLFVCYVVSKRITPMYESTAVLEIDREAPSGVVGQDAVRSAWNDSDQFIATQMKVIQEDSVLRPIAEKYHLSGEEKSETTAPTKLKQLRVTRPPETYLVQIGFRSPDPVLAANVANGIAESYVKHTFTKRLEDARSQTSFMEHQLDELRAGMERSGMAVAEFERRRGVIDPQEKTDILSARLMQLNTEYTSAQADRIKKEADYSGIQTGSLDAAAQSDQGDALKQLQQSLNEAQRKFTDIKAHYGPSHPEYTRQATMIAELQSQLDASRSSVAGRTSIAYQDAVKRETILKKELSEAKSAFDDLNARSFQYQTLKLEAEGNRKLYNDLEQRIKEAGINANFQNSSTHVSDYARPAQRPLYPYLPLNLGLALAFSLLLGVASVIIYDAANDKVQDLAQITRHFHTEVLGAIPEFPEPTTRLPPQPAASVVSIGSRVSSAHPLLAQGGALLDRAGSSMVRRKSYRLGQSQEAVKMLWSSFQLGNYGNKFRSLMMTSAVSGEGKTTICVQFALANARHERKTLLIDADLRRPSVHRAVELPLSPGVADAIKKPEAWRNYIRTSPLHENLHILSAGLLQRVSPDDLIAFLPQLIADAESVYDLVIIDSPPLLSFSEPLHMATVVDGVMVVACAGLTSRSALRAVLQTLSRLRVTVPGIVLNRAPQTTPDSYYTYAHYRTQEVEASA